MTNHSSLRDCEDALEALEDRVRRLPLASAHAVGPVTGLIYSLRGRLRSVGESDRRAGAGGRADRRRIGAAMSGSRKDGQATRTVEISLSEVVGWLSIVLRLAETRDEDTTPIQPGSMLRREAEAINRVLGPVWRELPADAREVACRELRQAWSPARVASIDAEVEWVAAAARLEGVRAEVKAQQWL